MFSPRQDKNKRIALNVEHLIRGGRIIGAFAITPNGSQITKTFSWYEKKKKKKKALNVGHWTFECDEK